MIRLTETLPELTQPSAELLKLHCIRDCYPDLALFWEQDGGGAYIGMLDADAVILNCGGDPEELAQFIKMLSPGSVFSDLATLRAIGLEADEVVTVMKRAALLSGEPQSDRLSSRELYDLLNVDGLSLPAYQHFAVDFCRRQNHGWAHFFALRGRCVAISQHHGNYALLTGIASRERGYGSRALQAILQKNYGRTLLACCRPDVRGFYEKNGFDALYEAAYWVKKQ